MRRVESLSAITNFKESFFEVIAYNVVAANRVFYGILLFCRTSGMQSNDADKSKISCK
jgi:hypothetical protein